ncbi:MAG: PTS sugar transporter subunit IIC [Lawsonibacter sp.]|nr:PTS sugar transporter subunit IIC [Lawsonibacter sp.]
MSLFQAILCGIIYYLGNSSILAGPIGYYTVYRPLVAGFLTGLVMGDPVTGTIIGATINLMYIGFISAGGALPGDMCLAGVLGTALGIVGGLETEAALAIAVPLGLLGTLLWFGRLTLDTFFVRIADKMVEKGQCDRIWIPDLLLPQLMLFCMTAIPGFLACYFGAQYVAPAINALGGTVLNVLVVVGGMMPALGIAITLKFIFKGDSKVFFFVGFLLSAYLGMSMIAIGFLAACAAVIYMQLKVNRKESALCE